MGAQHSTVGRTKSLDDSSVGQPPTQNNGSQANSSQPQLRSKNFHSRLDRDKRSKSTLVIVNASEPPHTPRVEDDPLFKKLNELPMFVPLMHEVETGSNIFGAKTRALAEIRSKIQPSPFIYIVRLYEERLRGHAESVNLEQARLFKCVKEVDVKVTLMFKVLTDRQKKFAKHAENFGKMNDMSHSLQKCQTMLKGCERNLQILNGMLSIEDRLEPFSWTELFNESVIVSDTKSNVESDESVEIAVEGVS